MRARILGLLVVVAFTTACSSDDDPETLPSVTSTASPLVSTASPPSTPTPTAMTTAELEAEITAFFEDYIDTVNKSWTSKEALERRRTMFKDTCSDCLAGYLFAKRAHDENLTVSGDDAALDTVKLIAATEHHLKVITTENLPAGLLSDPEGNVVQEFDEVLKAQTIYTVRHDSDGTMLITNSEAL